MKKLIIFLLVAGVFVWSYDHVVVEQQKDNVVNWAQNKAKAVRSVKVFGSTMVLDDMESYFSEYSSDEIEYITKVTSSEEKLKSYYNNYCSGSDFNPYIYGTHKDQFCQVIGTHYSKFAPNQ